MKKPTLNRFKKIAKSCNGNITSIANALSVSRRAVHNWMKEDQDFEDAVNDFKGALLDECVTMGRIVALGVPKRDENGRFVEWIERPDPSMLRYFMSTLGRKEGFGENIDLTTNGNDLPAARVISKEEFKEIFNNMNNEY